MLYFLWLMGCFAFCTIWWDSWGEEPIPIWVESKKEMSFDFWPSQWMNYADSVTSLNLFISKWGINGSLKSSVENLYAIKTIYLKSSFIEKWSWDKCWNKVDGMTVKGRRERRWGWMRMTEQRENRSFEVSLAICSAFLFLKLFRGRLFALICMCKCFTWITFMHGHGSFTRDMRNQIVKMLCN